MKYDTNNLIDVKRQALISMDLPVLKKIVEYEADSKCKQYFYSRLSEDCIRDKTGKIIEFDYNGDTSNHRTPIEVWDRIWTIEFAKRIHEAQAIPGTLITDILERPAYRSIPVVILEVPDETTFPLSDSFDWINTCVQWLADNNTWHRHRLNGIVFDKMFFEMEDKPLDHGVTWVSIASLAEDQILKLLSEEKYI